MLSAFFWLRIFGSLCVYVEENLYKYKYTTVLVLKSTHLLVGNKAQSTVLELLHIGSQHYDVLVLHKNDLLPNNCIKTKTPKFFYRNITPKYLAFKTNALSSVITSNCLLCKILEK
jgi:hypothetical protein